MSSVPFKSTFVLPPPMGKPIATVDLLIRLDDGAPCCDCAAAKEVAKLSNAKDRRFVELRCMYFLR
jgi:hypothetical protein